MAMEWYKKLNIDGEVFLNQGEFLFDYQINVPILGESGEIDEIGSFTVNLVLLTQSCDLVNRKITKVLACHFIQLKEFVKSQIQSRTLPDNNKSKIKFVEELRKGFMPRYHLLNCYNDSSHLKDYVVVDFGEIFTLELDQIEKFAKDKGTRILLNSPFNEHLSQAFARYFMRVGLPSDIRSTELAKKTKEYTI